MSVTILQINLHHSKAASAALMLHLGEDGAEVVLIQEPWIVASRVSGLKTTLYELFVAQCSGRIRTCILVKRKFNSFILSNHSNEDQTVVDMESSTGTIRLCSAYMPYDSKDPPPNNSLRDVITDSESKSLDLIVGCDANSHHHQWGSSDTNERGKSLFDYILSSKMLICNKGSDPTFITKNRREVLDVTLISSSLKDKVKSWRVLEKHSFSDHRYLQLVMSLTPSEKTTFVNFRKTNWDKFTSTLKTIIPETPPILVQTKQNIEYLVENFTNAINKAQEKSCRPNKPSNKTKPTWWTKELSDQRKITRKQFNQAKYYNSDEEWQKYKDSLKLYNKVLRTAKRSSWRNFCTEIEATSEASRLRKVLSKDPTPPGFLKRPDNSWTESSKETLELLLETHFPSSLDIESSNALFSNQGSPDYVHLLSDSNILWAIKSFKPFKSPGPDGIFPAQLNNAGNHAINWLKEIYSGILRLGFIPESWLKSKVVFIPKAGKPSHCNPKDFRPISLSSFLLKTLERLLNLHLRSVFPHNLLSKSQHAYTKGRSTETALHSLISFIENSLQVKDYTLVAFLDIEGAFNNIMPSVITSALSRLGVDDLTVGLINQLLQCRTVEASLGTSTTTKLVNRGTPQGGVLSPLLWNVAVNELLQIMEGGGCSVFAYADDIAIAFSGRFPQTLCDCMSLKLKKLSDWATKSGLGVNPSKTELVLFTRKYKIPVLKPPLLKGIPLKFSQTAKYLGLILDSKLSWNLMLEDRVRKANIALYTCKKAIGLKWGMSPQIVRWLYIAIIRPILTYGIVTWWPILEKKTSLKKLTTVQRTAELCISGGLRTTPTDALDTILHILPIDLYGKQTAASSALRMREAGNWKISSGRHTKILSNYAIIPEHTDYCVPSEYLFTPFSTFIPDRKEWNGSIPGPRNAIHIYTDGSKLDNHTGGGVFSVDLNINLSFRLPDVCSVFQAEVMAIKEALLHISPQYYGKKVCIFSDSQAAIKSLGSISSNSKVVNTCRRSLMEMAEHVVLHLIWVPGHNDIHGNCVADELARKGTSTPLNLERTHAEMPMATCRLLFRNHFENIANKRWRNIDHCRTARQIWPQRSSKRTEALLRLGRNMCTTVIRVITGHWLIGMHAEHLKLMSHDFCRSCQDEEEIETIKHFLCDCPALAQRRLKHLGAPFFSDILMLSEIPPCRMANFIKSSGWCETIHTRNE